MRQKSLLRIKEITIGITIFGLLLLQVSPILAQELPPPPPSVPTPPSALEPPPPPPPPAPPPVPTPSDPPVSQPPATTKNPPSTAPASQNITPANEAVIPSVTPTPVQSNQAGNNQPGSQNANGQTGDTRVITGNSTNSVSSVAQVNENLSTNGAGSGNSSGSTNNGSVTNNTTGNTIQENAGNIGNNLQQRAVTGQNSASQNVGNSAILSGDANTTGTVVTALNTNASGISVAEFNVADNHTGDLVLDFAKNCISGCGNQTAVNLGNGTDSTNSTQIDQTAQNNTSQTNDAIVSNNLKLASNSGDNIASKNTGDSTIQTGNANVAGNALTFANNNLAGKVIFGVVNIFGNLVGDIVLPDQQVACSNCNSQTTASNIGNSSGSTNTAGVNLSNTTDTFQRNDASIENNLTLAAATGENDSNKNTGENSTIQTGNADVKSQTVNVANSNVSGGNMWLVFVNQAGEWVGKILGVPEGSNFAGSSNTQFTVGQDGTITATNSGNGSGSQNSASTTQTTDNNINQSNTAHVVNNLNLSANSGGNVTSDNTGGSSFIKTGDAKILANIVNFVNNNIASDGKLVVTFVNVFGSWIGDFVTPGHQKDPKTNPPGNPGLPPGNSGVSNKTQSSDNSSGDQGKNSENTSHEENTANLQPPSLQTNLPAQFTTQVAGVRIAADNLADSAVNNLKNDTDQVRRSITLNLAWLLILIPLGMLPAFPKIIRKFREN